ncbi:MAG: 2-oxoglutarate dehydrogenase E1 component, partial [Parasphingorhabdus sp.]
MGFEGQEFLESEKEPGPSWQRKHWPIDDADELNSALDPTQMGIEIKAAAAKSGKAMSDAEVGVAAEKSIRAMMLIRTYRVRGHLGANLDPLGLSKLEQPADLTPEFHGFTADEMDKQIFLGGVLGFETATIREIEAVLRANYCGSVGL